MANQPEKKETILVVDDSPDTLGMVTLALEELGATVLVALGGDKAMEILDKITPDVILMDCIMPGMDGFETCQKIKQIPLFKHTPVIFMTGLSETDHIVKGLSCGGVDYLTKPINPVELIARMQVHLANARQTRNAQTVLDSARRHIIACDPKGKIKWATPEASLLLKSSAEPATQDNLYLPQKMIAWLENYKTNGHTPSQDLELLIRDGLKLLATFIGQSDKDEFLFRLIEINDEKDQAILTHHFDLTQREAEVLLWVAHGKSNKDIGEILDISPRTINKHLQLIFTKLGTENRTAAAMQAMRALWGDST